MYHRRFLLLVTSMILSFTFLSCNQHNAQDLNNLNDVFASESFQKYKSFKEEMVSALGKDLKLEIDHSLPKEEKLLQLQEKHLISKQKTELVKEVNSYIKTLEKSDNALEKVNSFISLQNYPQAIISSTLKFYSLKLSGEETRLASIVLKEFPTILNKEKLDKILFDLKINHLTY